MPADRVDALTEHLYEAALGDLPWETALESLARLLDANSAAITVDQKGGGGWGVSFGAADRSFHEAYFTHYGAINPLAARVLTAPEGSVLTEHMAMRRADYERSEFYSDWARPQGFQYIVHVRVENRDDALTGVGLTRSTRTGNFEQGDIDLLQRLAPHLRRSVRTYLRLAEIRTTGFAMGEALDRMQRGAIGLDVSGRVIFANQAARLLLKSDDTLRVVGDLLVAVRADWTATLRRMVEAAICGRATGPMLLPRVNGRSALLLEILPVARLVASRGLNSRPAALLVLTDPDSGHQPGVASLRRIYGLTAKEAEVAIHAATGEELAAIAAVLGVARSTVQSHLKRIYDKTDTHRQAELAWLVARLSG